MRRDGAIVAIGAFKLVKAAVLIAAGLGAIQLLHVGGAGKLAEWAQLAPGSRLVQRAAGKVGVLSEKQLEGIAFGTFLYAALFIVEGAGLLARKRWAEWLTAIITASFIPLEIYELVKHFGAGKIVTLVVNVAILVYLAVRLRKKRSE